jgi:N-acetylmuramoyl-L-alanine amidase
MPSGLCPLVPYDPGAEPVNDPIDVRTVVLHRTIGFWPGDYSVGKNRTHEQGTFQFLIGQAPGEWVQFYPVDNYCSHGYGANNAGPGIEISGRDGEALTDWQIDALGQIMRWLRDTWGIAPTFTDGDPRVAYDHAGPSGFVTHRNIYSDIPKFTHYDYITGDEFARAMGGQTPAPLPPIEDTMWLLLDIDTQNNYIATANAMILTPGEQVVDLVAAGIKRYDVPNRTIVWLGEHLKAPAGGQGGGGSFPTSGTWSAG